MGPYEHDYCHMLVSLERVMNVRNMIRRYADGCYAVVIGSKRGPCAHSKPEAYRRYRRSGCIAWAKSD